MDTKLLKQKILDLAIRGKLVPQDPNDEPASVLLERIRAEREKLIKQGKLKRSKSTSDNQHYQNVPFEIPASWECATLEFVCSKIGSGSTPRGSNYAVSGIPFFRSQNVYDEGLVYDDIKFISEEIHQQMKSTEVLPNDVLLNITGGSLGRCAVVPSDFERGNVSQHVCILRPIIVETQYIHCFILSGHFSQTMKVTGSGREGLPKYNLEKMIVPIPPLNEQRRIVAEVNRWFSLISDLERNESELNETIKATKAKVLDLAIHGRLVSQDLNDEPASELLKRIAPHTTPCDTSHYENLPQGWCILTVGEVADYINGRAFKPTEWEQKGLPIIRIQNLNDKDAVYNYSTAKFEDKYLVHKGDLLFAWAASLGTYIWQKDYAWLNQHIFKVIPKPFISRNFLYYSFINMIDDFYAESHGSGMVHITKGKFETRPILIPPIAEQKRIVERIETIFASLDTITAEL